jgi:hypothetical protein
LLSVLPFYHIYGMFPFSTHYKIGRKKVDD